MGRPQKAIDAGQVEELAKIGCKTTEMAAVLDCSVDTLERRFAAEIEKGRAEGKISLRRAQIASALNGNVAMLIWLGKQYLGQRDQLDLEHTGEVHGILGYRVTPPPDAGTGDTDTGRSD